MANMVFRLSSGQLDSTVAAGPSQIDRSVGGMMSMHDSQIIQSINSSYNNIFKDINLKQMGSVFGRAYEDYTVIYMHNDSDTKYETFVQPELFSEFDTSLAKYELAILPKNEIAEILASPMSPPSNVIFKKATQEKPLRMIGGDKFSAYLGQGEFCAIYIKRILEQGVVSDLKTNLDDSFSLYARGYE